MTTRRLVLLILAVLLGPAIADPDAPPALPSRKASVVLPILEKFSEADRYSKVEKILGKPDMDIGSGIYIYVFRLDDGTSVTVGTADRNYVLDIYRSGRQKGDASQAIFKSSNSALPR